MSNDLAYYLKYRPQTLSELIGQNSVKKTLLHSFENNKLSHAYLFVGPRGTGKTSTARILAKMVNCESQSSIPCNKCPTCISITDGSNLDLIEIDAASNRGIEDIRSLRDKIKLSPTSSRKKVYIIDETHMLTQEAFNALLKTLEEPPKHALFILATTDSSKLPPTILSRVQRLDFKLASAGEISQALEKIIKQEQIDIETEAVKILIKMADGSFRDAVKLLDQVSSSTGTVTAKALVENLKMPIFDDILRLLENIGERSVNKSFLLVSKQIENGVDIRELILSLMETLRNLVFIKNGLGEQLVKPQFTADKYEELVRISDIFRSQDLVGNLDILQSSLEKLKFASIPSLPLELGIVEMCGGVTIETDSVETKNQKTQKISQPASQTENTIPDIPAHSDSPDMLKLKEKWTFVLETIRPYNLSLEALLRSINISGCAENKVYMEVPYSFHQRILEAPKNKDLLEGVLSDILGRTISVSVILGNRPKMHDIANIEVAEDDEIIKAAAEIFNSDSIN